MKNTSKLRYKMVDIRNPFLLKKKRKTEDENSRVVIYFLPNFISQNLAKFTFPTLDYYFDVSI